MHDEIVTVRKAAGVCRSNVNGIAEPEDKSPASGDGWKTTTKGGRTVKQSVNSGGQSTGWHFRRDAHLKPGLRILRFLKILR